MSLGLVWAFCIALLLQSKRHLSLDNYVRQFKTHHGMRQQGVFGESLTSGHAARATCDATAQPSPAAVQRKFAAKWGQSCAPFLQACYDEGTFVVYGKAHHPSHPGGKAPREALKLGNNHLDFKEFGDTIGIMQYPEIIFRPGNQDEEVPDLSNPAFSNCARPVVFYLNHLFMFGDFWVRTMPTFINAVESGAWDTDYTIIIATGGQKLEAWQKLMLQPLTKHPVVTLSMASSRALAYSLSESDAPHSQGGSSSSSAGNARRSGVHKQRRRLHTTPQLEQQQQQQQQWEQHLEHSAMQQQQQQAYGVPHSQWYLEQQHQDGWKRWLKPQLQVQTQQQRTSLQAGHNRTLQWQIQQPEPLPSSTPPITQYGRCFESLTVCSVQNPRGFGGTRVPREIWAGGQHVRAYWERLYGLSYKQLLPQYEKLRQPDAFRVVFAVRGDKGVRNLLNTQVRGAMVHEDRVAQQQVHSGCSAPVAQQARQLVCVP